MTTRAERIAEIRERVEKATPGPWWAIWDGDHQALGGCCLVKRGNDVIAVIEGTGLRAEANAAIIAHARQDVPWLLDEIEFLEQQVRELTRTFLEGLAIDDPAIAEIRDRFG